MPVRYFAEASSINFRRSLNYGILCCATALQYRLDRAGLVRSPLFERKDAKAADAIMTGLWRTRRHCRATLMDVVGCNSSTARIP